MAFRADESQEKGLENLKRYLISRDFTQKQKEVSSDLLLDIVEKHGPVIDTYPSWHPLVSANYNSRCPVTTPGERCGYKGLDHTRHLMNGFITCPYYDCDAVIESVNKLPYNPVARIKAERLDKDVFYNTGTTPVLVYCDWEDEFYNYGMIPKRIAIPLMLEQVIPTWKDSQLGETWETMQPYFLGQPHGSRSSLFVDQKTGQMMKKIWEMLINTGMFGPIKV